MERIGPTLKTLFVLGLAVHIHHKLKGPPVDYVGLALASAASFIGLPGPGEPLLIALAIFAAKHKLDITEVVVVAFLGAVSGGLIGWLVGLKAGRRLLTAPGPLLSMRAKALAHGDDVFKRHPVLGILLTPAPVAGIHRVRPAVYLPVNFVSAAVWAAGIGYGAYYLGPAIVDWVNDAGVLAAVALVLLVLGSISTQMLRRRRQRNAGRVPGADGEASET